MRTKFPVLVVLACAGLLWGVSTTAPIAAPRAAPQSPVVREVASVPRASTAVASKELLDRFCLGCHNEKARTAGVDSARKLALDTLDVMRVDRDARAWELVARKLRAGMMPPPGMPRPDRATFDSLIYWLESELDRTATPYTPPPGLHRLNRTEYANAVLDLLDLPIDPAK